MAKMLWRPFLLVAGMLSAAAAAPAQELGGEWRPLGQIVSTTYQEGFGSALAAGGDLDGDGYPELAVGLAGRRDAQGRTVGAVQLRSARSGVVYWEFEAPYVDTFSETGDRLSWVPDADGDGFPDVLSANWAAEDFRGKAMLLSGTNGLFIREHVGTIGPYSQYGSLVGNRVLGIADVDGDGRGDYLISADGSDDPNRALQRTGRLDCYSGATGQLIWQRYGAQEDARFPHAVVLGPDLNGDGRADILASSGEAPPGVASGGTIYALDPRDGQIVRTYGTPLPSVAHQGFGSELGILPDLDGDGLEEIVASATVSDTRLSPDAGYVTLISSADGSPFWFAQGGHRDGHFGREIFPVGDLDQDGHDDLAIYEPQPFTPFSSLGDTLHVVSGASGDRLWGFGVGTGTAREFGRAVESFDRTDDGLPELFIAEVGYSGGGRILVLSLAPYLYSGTRELSAASPGELRLRLDFPASEAGLDYGVFASGSGQGPTALGGVDVPLTADGVFRRSLQSPPPAFRGTLDAQGDGRVRVQMPSAPLTALIGSTLHFAAVSGSGAQARRTSVAVPVDVTP